MNRLLLFATLLLAACGGSGSSAVSDTAKKETLSPKDSMKRLAGQLPPPTDIKQFKWFYSLFVEGVKSENKNNTFNKFIDPKHGLYIIETSGAIPGLKKVMDIGSYKHSSGKMIYDLLKSCISCDPQEADLPTVDCNKTSRWNKDGCFTREINTFKDDKPWQYSHLSSDEEKNVAAMAQTISRTVVITECHCRLYFSLVNGSWFLSFIDLSSPCEA